MAPRNRSLLILPIFIILISGCVGGSYGTGSKGSGIKTLNWDPEKDSQSDELDSNALNLPWFFGSTCTFDALDIRVSTEFGKIRSAQAGCSIELPVQAQDIRLEFIGAQVTQLSVPYVLERINCKKAGEILNKEEGRISVLRNTVRLPRLTWNGASYLRLSLQLDSTKRISIELHQSNETGCSKDFIPEGGK